MRSRPLFGRAAALGLALAALGCKDPRLYEDVLAMAKAGEAALRARGHCPPPHGQCGGYNLFAEADNGRAVYLTLYAVSDPAAIAEVIDSCAAISLRSPRRPSVELRVYRRPHGPPPGQGGSATRQSPVYTVTMRHE